MAHRSGPAVIAIVVAGSIAGCADDTSSADVASTGSSAASTSPTTAPATAATPTTVTATNPATGASDPASIRWSAAPSLLRPRSAHGVVELGGTLYALGGTGEDGKPVFEVERFDGTAWSDVTEIAGYGVNAPSAAAVDGRIYLIGGFIGTSGRPTGDVQVYDSVTSTWSMAAPLPTPSGGHAATVLDGRIHVIGGGTERSTIADHQVYDPATDSWTALAPLPQSEGSPAAVVLDGRLWAIGGRSGRSDFGEVFVYDPATDAWTPGPAIEPHSTAGAAVACGTIFLVGGESQERLEVLGDVLRLDGAAWLPADPLPTPRSFARTVVLDGSIYVVGGSTVYGHSHTSPGSSAVERLTPDC